MLLKETCDYLAHEFDRICNLLKIVSNLSHHGVVLYTGLAFNHSLTVERHTHITSGEVYKTQILQPKDEDDIMAYRSTVCWWKDSLNIHLISKYFINALKHLYQGQTHRVCFHSSWQVSLVLSASFHWTPPLHLWWSWPPVVELISPLDSKRTYTPWKAYKQCL